MGEMVTIPREEYEALKEAREDLADLRAYDRAKAALASGVDELVPSDVVQRLLEGESPLRVWREYRGLSQTRLALKSGVNRVQIINIESGERNGSVATLRKLADALGVDLDELA